MFEIKTTSRFDKELEEILDFIALDSVDSALHFYDALMEKIYPISTYPYMYRQRKNLQEEIRELIFKGYTIPYLVDHDNKIIFLLGIFNRNQWE